MVDVARSSKQHIERDLDRAYREWSRLPEVERTIDAWPDYEAIDYLVQWGLEEMNLNRLRRYAERGELRPDQQARFEALLPIVERNRPIIDRLINGSPTDGASSERHDRQNDQNGAS